MKYQKKKNISQSDKNFLSSRFDETRNDPVLHAWKARRRRGPTGNLVKIMRAKRIEEETRFRLLRYTHRAKCRKIIWSSFGSSRKIDRLTQLAVISLPPANDNESIIDVRACVCVSVRRSTGNRGLEEELPS